MTLSTPRLALIFALLLALFLVAMFPLSLALRWAGLDRTALSATQVRGSIWSGSLEGVSVGGSAFGNVDVGMSPLRLLAGTAAFRFAGVGGTPPSGIFERSGAARAARDVTATVPLPGTAATLGLAGLNARFEGGSCVKASGAATAEISLADAGTARLSGNARCDGDRLLLPLAGTTAAGPATLDIRVAAAGEYSYRLGLTAADPAIAQRLAAAGFVPDGGQVAMLGSGRL